MVKIEWEISRNDEIETTVLVTNWTYTVGTDMVTLGLKMSNRDIHKITELIRRASPIRMRWSVISVKDK